MATIRQSQSVNMEGWVPATLDQRVSSTPPARTPFAKSAYMISSMPAMASAGDALQRQFYGNDRVPTRRILPLAGGPSS